MSTRDATKIEKGPGRLIISPTDLAAAPLYGGTELGATRGHEEEYFAEQFPIPYEEYGGVPGEAVSGGEWCMIYALMRQWDNDVVNLLWPNTSTGTSGGKVATATVATGVRAGSRLSDRAVKLLYVPNDLAQEALLIYRAGPMIVGRSRIMRDIMRESNIAASFLSLLDAAGRIYQRGKLGDLTL